MVSYSTPDKMLQFSVEIIFVATSVVDLGWLKKKKKKKKEAEENLICWLAALESFPSLLCLFSAKYWLPIVVDICRRCEIDLAFGAA